VGHGNLSIMNLSDNWTAGQHPVVRVSAAETIFSALRGAIESGELAVGTKLSSETLLAQQYGVSRSVVREALRSTTALGLTSTQTGKGTFVVAGRVARDLVLGSFSARELSEARPHIEVPAAQLAAHRRTADDLDTLSGIVESMLEEDDPQVWVNLDGSFHAEIARASGNGVFGQVVAAIREAMANQSETLNLIAGRMQTSNAEHQAILKAIADRSGEKAAQAMRFHLSAVNEALETIYGAEHMEGHDADN
jgi:GntR family transcriptional repressor for pyruvate dehydrogenase complex